MRIVVLMSWVFSCGRALNKRQDEGSQYPLRANPA
jgi:hypothetical protein